MDPASVAFQLGHGSARLAAVVRDRTRLVDVGGEALVAPVAGTPGDLDHAVRTTVTRLAGLASELGATLPAASGPVAIDEAWRQDVVDAVGARLDDDLARRALAAGAAAGALEAATLLRWCVMVLRRDLPAHAALAALTGESVVMVAAAGQRLAEALAAIADRPVVTRLGAEVAAAVAAVPGAAAIEPATGDDPFAWRRTLELAVSRLGKAFAIPVEPPVLGPATAEEDAMVAAVLAAPDDDTPRRRIAELAVLRRDPRGELIAAQLAVTDLIAARAPASARAAPRTRAAQLLLAHPEWQAPVLELGATLVAFRHGFIDDVTMLAAAFIAGATTLLARAPVRTLRLRDAGGHGAGLAAVPELARLTTLDLQGSGLTDDDVAALAASPHLGALQRLDLANNRITDRGVDALAASTRLPGLVWVSVERNPCIDPVDEAAFHDTHRPWDGPTARAQALEAAHGPRRWLHPGGSSDR